jgi:hypothetical protein
MSNRPFKAFGKPLNITAGVASAAYPLPITGTVLDILMSHLGTVAGESVYYALGDSTITAAIPAFDGSTSDLVLAAGSIQTRRINANVTHIAVISAIDNKVSIEIGEGN